MKRLNDLCLAGVTLTATIFGFYLVSCGSGSGGKAQADDEGTTFRQSCQVIAFNGTMGRRCENQESICYILGESLSCFKKD